VNNLMLLSGPRKISDWVTLDSRPGADYVQCVPPFPLEIYDREWDNIELIHGIEHFYLWEARELLQDIFQILRNPGGKLVLEQPNIEVAARILLKLANGNINQMCMWALYGDPKHEHKGMCHHWGYTPDTLTDELLRAGFNCENIRVLPAQHHVRRRDFRIEATR